MGRKGKRSATPANNPRSPAPPTLSKPAPLSPTAQAALTEVRSLYSSLATNFKAKRKLRHRGEPLHLALLKGDIRHKLASALSSLTAAMPESDVQNVMKDFGDGLADILAAEIPDIAVREEFQVWMSETPTLMYSIGAELQALTADLFPSKLDLAQEFKLAILEKANGSFAQRLAPKGSLIAGRMAARKRNSWLVPPKSSDDPKLGNMSLDEIMDFISEAEDSQSEQPDEFGVEVAQFRRRLEGAWILERKVVPVVSDEWLQRVCRRPRVSAA